MIQPEIYISAAVIKRYECAQKDVWETMGTNQRNVSLCVRQSQKHLKATDEGRCQGETELVEERKTTESKITIEQSKQSIFIKLSKYAVNLSLFNLTYY